MSGVFDSLKLLMPAAEVHPDVEAFLSQSENHQVVFMDFKEDVLVPEHSHAAQLEIVIAGELELTTPEGIKIYKTGDLFYLENGVPHAGKVKKGYKSIGVFFQKDRYKAKA